MKQFKLQNSAKFIQELNEKGVRLYQFSIKANVSTSSVRRALNGSSVSFVTAIKITQAAKDFNIKNEILDKLFIEKDDKTRFPGPRIRRKLE